MRINFVFLTIALLTILAGGCHISNNTPDVSDIKVDFELKPFYEKLFSIPPEEIEMHLNQLQEEYGRYFDAYCEGIIGIGATESLQFRDNFLKFLTYKPNLEVVDSCQTIFSKKRKESLYNHLLLAFKYYRYYYPEREIPDIYLHISGFNESMVVDSGWISVSVEKYLGRNCIFYEWLGTPKYLRNQMDTERVVPDVMRAIAMTEYSYNDSINDLISQMVYHGKILQFVKHTIPNIPDTLLFGFSQKQMKWCDKNESSMWASIVEHKHLFSTDQMLIRKYVGPAPFTSVFGQDSPGQTGRYLGYKILESWMEENPDQSFRDMMEQTDPHNILRQAKYRP
ncbi:gliding motility lipoprotein GldB [Thermophagus sp. OGC60D27]|uniref:gliding motility lipoprotein GldB n=1 Tax=Thermophagus sp. OGC60D27 TaxID=3458415 RepID=UPI004038073C